jgi:metal-responsive CopG/Arc/MetJ family transcriptional regulator
MPVIPIPISDELMTKIRMFACDKSIPPRSMSEIITDAIETYLSEEEEINGVVNE